MRKHLTNWRSGRWRLLNIQEEPGEVSAELLRAGARIHWDYMDDEVRQPMKDLALSLTELMGRQVYFDLARGRIRVFLGGW